MDWGKCQAKCVPCLHAVRTECSAVDAMSYGLLTGQHHQEPEKPGLGLNIGIYAVVQ